MGRKTISLDDSAYSKLKACKRPGESFSDVIHRILGDKEPSFLDFHRLLEENDAERLAEAVARMREEDMQIQQCRSLQSG